MMATRASRRCRLALLSLALAGVAANRPVRQADAPPGEVTITFAAAGPELAEYRTGRTIVLQSARARLNHTGDRGILIVYLSDLKGLDCRSADKTTIEGSSFVLTVTVYLTSQSVVEPGRKDDLGVIIRTVAGLHVKVGSLGSITLDRVTPGITGTLALDDREKLKVTGHFSATMCE